MRYWAFLIAKLTVAMGVLYGLLRVLLRVLPKPEPVMQIQLHDAFGFDLWFTLAIFVFGLAGAGIIAAIVVEQRYRCRECLCTLRMPVNTGSWPNMLLEGRPGTEYICPFGHGSLRVPQVLFDGWSMAAWQENGDIWKELFKA